MDQFSLDEINNSHILEAKITSYNDNDFEIIFNSQIGATLIQTQKVEFTLLGIVSHFNEAILKKDKRFKELNPQRFLSNSEADIKYKKQTLGVIIEFLKKQQEILNQDELEEYLKNRNNFVHNLFRNYLQKQATRIEKTEALKFSLTLYRDSIKWLSILKGMMYQIAKIITDNNDMDPSVMDRFENLKTDYLFFLKKILPKNE